MKLSQIKYKQSNKMPFPHNTLKVLLDIISQYKKTVNCEDKSDLEARLKILQQFIVPNVRGLDKDELQTVDKEYMISSIRSLSNVLLGIRSSDCVDMQREVRAILDNINSLETSVGNLFGNVSETDYVSAQRSSETSSKESVVSHNDFGPSPSELSSILIPSASEDSNQRQTPGGRAESEFSSVSISAPPNTPLLLETRHNVGDGADSDELA
ncbi:uncharacterized protein LOC119080783 [Bradysia coprophila]|uniref:uncharacterized protein LOC119080783 n=1 Tax=Bradysia coprophila TaxID=38358 RepID=UPI00187D726B|nr:uncharacterized protein LOC119080783 [Bradysia coprophila]